MDVLSSWANEDAVSASDLDAFQRRIHSQSRRTATAGMRADATMLERSFGGGEGGGVNQEMGEDAKEAIAEGPSSTVREHHERRLEELSRARARRKGRVEELAALLDADQSSSFVNTGGVDKSIDAEK